MMNNTLDNNPPPPKKKINTPVICKTQIISSIYQYISGERE